MIVESMEIGLAVERRELSGPWGGHVWRPIAIFVSAPAVAPSTPLGSGKDFVRYYAGSFPIHLFSTETANYRDNLTSGTPKLWVIMRDDGTEPLIKVALVTADPAEGEASTEAGNNIVETIAMPPELVAAVAAFVEAHHIERAIIKRQRDGKPPTERWRNGGPAKNKPDDHK